MSRRNFLIAAAGAAGLGYLGEQRAEHLLKHPERTGANMPPKPEVKNPYAETTIEKVEHKPGQARVVDLSRETKRIPGELVGHRRSLDVQNEMADADRLRRLDTEDQMKALLKSKENPNGILVEIPRGKFIQVDPYVATEGDFTYTKTSGHGRNKTVQHLKGHKYRRDYCCAWTADFLRDLADDYGREFPNGPALMVSSGVRPWDVQRDLHDRLGNPNPSPRSIHPTGTAIDIVFDIEPKKYVDGLIVWKKDSRGKILKDKHKNSIPETVYDGLPPAQKRWVEGRLIQFKRLPDHIIEPEQEGSEPCYHIAVPRAYKALAAKHKQKLYY